MKKILYIFSFILAFVLSIFIAIYVFKFTDQLVKFLEPLGYYYLSFGEQSLGKQYLAFDSLFYSLKMLYIFIPVMIFYLFTSLPKDLEVKRSFTNYPQLYKNYKIYRLLNVEGVLIMMLIILVYSHYNTQKDRFIYSVFAIVFNLFGLIFSYIKNILSNKVMEKMKEIRNNNFELSDLPYKKSYHRRIVSIKLLNMFIIFLITFFSFSIYQKINQNKHLLKLPTSLILNENVTFDDYRLETCNGYFEIPLSCRLDHSNILSEYTLSRIELEVTNSSFIELLKGTDYEIELTYNLSETFRFAEGDYILEVRDDSYYFVIENHFTQNPIMIYDKDRSNRFLTVSFIHSETNLPMHLPNQRYFSSFNIILTNN